MIYGTDTILKFLYLNGDGGGRRKWNRATLDRVNMSKNNEYFPLLRKRSRRRPNLNGELLIFALFSSCSVNWFFNRPGWCWVNGWVGETKASQRQSAIMIYSIFNFLASKSFWVNNCLQSSRAQSEQTKYSSENFRCIHSNLFVINA